MPLTRGEIVAQFVKRIFLEEAYLRGQISFRFDQALPLPADVHLWVAKEAAPHESLMHPERRRKPDYLHVTGHCDGSSCDRCSCAGTGTSGDMGGNGGSCFMAISPQAASYIVLDTKFLQAFMLLREGYTPNEVAGWYAEPAAWKGFMQDLLTKMVVRNFLVGAETKEDVSERPTLHLYVTNRCNLRCTHCYMSSGKPLSTGEMDTAGRRAAIDAFTRLGRPGRVSFSGGEAMTSPDLFPLMRYAKERGHSVELYTNGVLINERNVRHIVETVDELQISLDGTDPDSNDPVRGSGTFEKIVRGINLVDKADRSTNPAFLYRIGLTLTSSNQEDLETNLLPFLSALRLENPHRIKVGVVGKIGRAKDNPAVAGDIDDLTLVQSRIMRHFVSSGRMRFPNLQVNRFSTSCGIGSAITVSADGKVYPCTVTSQPALGDLMIDDPQAVMRLAADYTGMTHVDKIDGCSTCSLRYSCSGMCRVTNLHKTGSMTRSNCSPSYKAGKVAALMSGFGSFFGNNDLGVSPR